MQRRAGRLGLIFYPLTGTVIGFFGIGLAAEAGQVGGWSGALLAAGVFLLVVGARSRRGHGVRWLLDLEKRRLQRFDASPAFLDLADARVGVVEGVVGQSGDSQGGFPIHWICLDWPALGFRLPLAGYGSRERAEAAAARVAAQLAVQPD